MGTGFLFLSFFFTKKSSFAAVMLCAPSQVRGAQPLGPEIRYRSDSATNFLLPRGQAYRRMGCGAMQFSYLTFKEINGYSMDSSMR